MSIITREQLFENELSYWIKKNIELFGVTAIDEMTPAAEIQAELDVDCEKYWNGTQLCDLAKKFNDGTLDADSNLRVPNTYRLELNPYNFCIDIYSKYNVKDEVQELQLASIPTPSVDLSWIINNAHYTPRVTSERDDSHFVVRYGNTVNGEFWKYDIEKDEFTCVSKSKFDVSDEAIFEKHLSKRSKMFIQSCMDEELTAETLRKGLASLKVVPHTSILRYKFSRVGFFENAIFNSKKYASPTKKILLGVNMLILNNANNRNSSDKYGTGSLVLTTSESFSLENFRQVINTYKASSDFSPAFSYSDITGFFDAFKTSTTKNAGKHRLLLDNIIVKDDILWVKTDEGEINMFEAIKNPQKDRLSCMSYSMFCHNNKAKRIMMTAKLSTQAVPLIGEDSSISHRIKARVGFTDIEGYTYGDAILISESFAKKLTTYNVEIINLTSKNALLKSLKAKYQDNSSYKLDINDLFEIFPKRAPAILDSYQNAEIILFDDYKDCCRVFVSYEIPFLLGDKLSNLHGAKGVVGKILPDEEMPKLINDVGVNMKAGELDIIISGFSTIRRGSLGQIFEAWANASGIELGDDEDYISKVKDKYKDQIKEYSEKSIVEYKGVQRCIPVGLIDIIRLNHHASTHLSESSVHNFNFNKMLKFGEMERLNLYSLGLHKTLEELSIRSMHKYFGSYQLVNDMENTGKLPVDKEYSLKFVEILKSMGYMLYKDNKPVLKSDLRSVNFSEEDIEKLNSREVEN